MPQLAHGTHILPAPGRYCETRLALTQEEIVWKVIGSAKGTTQQVEGAFLHPKHLPLSRAIPLLATSGAESALKCGRVESINASSSKSGHHGEHIGYLRRLKDSKDDLHIVKITRFGWGWAYGSLCLIVTLSSERPALDLVSLTVQSSARKAVPPICNRLTSALI